MGVTNGYSQNTVKATDINGLWQSTKPGAELFIDINSPNATISSIGKTTLTNNIVGGKMYEKIQYDGNNVWTAQRNAWIYNGIAGNNSEKGHWEKANPLKLNLSNDKNTLTASGHWTYTRVVKMIGSIEEISASTSQKQTITEDFGGVIGTFTVVDKPQGGDFILAKLANKTKDKLAIVIISLDGGKIINEQIEPQMTLTKKYDAKTLDIQILYQDANLPDETFNLIDFVKDKIRKQVIKENGKLKTSSNGGMGARG